MYSLSVQSDSTAEHIGTVLQKRIVTIPHSYKRNQYLLVRIHGSQGDAGSQFNRLPGNNPSYPLDISPHTINFTESISKQMTVVYHDFLGVNPFLNIMDDEQFGSPHVMAILEDIRTNLAPKLGCRSDKILLSGSSQGSLNCLYYLFLYPDHVGGVWLTYTGSGDIEGPRLTRPKINDNWSFSPRGATYSMRLIDATHPTGVNGPRLTLRGAWTPSITYSVNDIVVVKTTLTQYATNAWRCLTAHTSSSTFPGEGSQWTALDPLKIHFDGPSESGTSLVFPTGSPLAGQVATLIEPSNITRMKQIIDGTITGTPVPLHIFYSRGDIIPMGATVNGVVNGGPWFFDQIGADVTIASTWANHSGDQAAPQPIDIDKQTTTNVQNVNDEIDFTIPVSRQFIVKTPSFSGSATLTWERRIKGQNTAGSGGAPDLTAYGNWTAVNGWTTQDVLAGNNEGTPSTTAVLDGTQANIFRIDGLGGVPLWTSGTTYAVGDVIVPDVLSTYLYVWVCLRAHTASGTTFPGGFGATWIQSTQAQFRVRVSASTLTSPISIVAGPTYPTNIQWSTYPVDLIVQQMTKAT